MYWSLTSKHLKKLYLNLINPIYNSLFLRRCCIIVNSKYITLHKQRFLTKSHIISSHAQLQRLVLITYVISIGGVFVLDPANLPILVLVIVFPVLVHVLLDVPALPVLDPMV